MKIFSVFLIILLSISCAKTEIYSGSSYIYGVLPTAKTLYLKKDGLFTEIMITPIEKKGIIYQDTVIGNYYKTGDTLVLTLPVFRNGDSNNVIFEKYLMVKSSLVEIYFTSSEFNRDSSGTLEPEILKKD